MSIYAMFCALLVLALAIHFINRRFVKIQSTIAITIGAFLVSMVLILCHHLDWFNLETPAELLLSQFDFRKVLLDGMLGFLLFGGTLFVDYRQVKKYKFEIATLASVGTLASTFIIAAMIYYILQWLGHGFPFLICLLFGALISPTDPIAVIAIVKEMKAPKALETKIAGESLCNDGVGLVIFVTLYQLAFGGIHPTWQTTLLLFLREVIGGILYGLLIGGISVWMIRLLRDMRLEILLTICIASAGYVFAQSIGISGPLAMVTAGLMVGNCLRQSVSNNRIVSQLWEIADEVLNTVLFLLIGLELLTFNVQIWYIIAGVLAIPVVLFTRLVTVAVPMQLFKKLRRYAPHATLILTWGGLRGALALAMALSIPPSIYRDTLIMITYCVVLFSIVVQGLTVGPLVRRSLSLDRP